MMLSLQIFPDPVGYNVVDDKDEGGDENEALGADEAASESVNRSSSFLFDSLCDSSLLAGLSPRQIPDQSDEEESVTREIGEKRPLPSTQERRRSELLANQEAEWQEAIQWGESSFNLSEWGDSLLVGEHFLERQSRGREASLHEALQTDTDQVLPEEQLSQSQAKSGGTQPQPTTTATTTTQKDNDEDKSMINRGNKHEIKANNNAQNDSQPGGIQETKNEKCENGKQEEKKIIKISDNVFLKHPQVQDVPESTFSCSPGLQEIFDRWPSMSDQTWQNTTTGHTTNHTHAANTAQVSDLPQSSIQTRIRAKPNEQVAAAESDPPEEQPSRHNSEDVAERPGSAGDLIPPTQETPPVTPRVKLTTSSVHSPLTVQPLSQSTPSTLLRQKPAVTNCSNSRPGRSDHLSKTDSKQPNSSSDHSHKQHQGPIPETHPVSQSSSKTKPQYLRSPQDPASPSSPRQEPPSDVESPVTDEGFTLQLSQDASLCSSNSGSFSIIDVASDRCLFNTFINEWKTKERYSLALACEKREPRHMAEEEIGGKHKRGMD